MKETVNVKALSTVLFLLTAKISNDEEQLLNKPLKKLKNAEIDCVVNLSQYCHYLELAKADAKESVKYCRLLRNKMNSEESNETFTYALNRILDNVESYYHKAMDYHREYKHCKRLLGHIYKAA